MKAILGSLRCFVLFASECVAIKGGPPYPGNTASLAGTYAGVLQPTFDQTDPFSSNSLGVFTLGIPTDGASTGTFPMFTRGRIFGGSIQGVTDPNKAKVNALIFATFNHTLEVVDSTGTPHTFPVTARVTVSLPPPVPTTTNTPSQARG